MKHWRNLLPFVISAGLIAWLMSQVSPSRVIDAAEHLRWQLLVPATAAMVLALYFWDGLCLKVVYGTRQDPISYPRMLQVRGMSYLVSALHCQLGQAMVVWNVARIQGASLVATLSRGLLLLYHDTLVLMSAGLVGSLLSDSPRAPPIALFCGAVLGLLACLGLTVALLPPAVQARFERTRWGAWRGSWTWRRSVGLLLLRVVYYAILGVYATTALGICRIDVDYATILGTIPLVLVADALPSISGLGTREFALLELLGAEHPDVIVAMGLFWSTGLIVFRLAIGLAHLWLCQGILRPAEVSALSDSEDTP